MSKRAPPPVEPVRHPDPVQVEVAIEVPRFGFVKRRGDGSVDFVSPLPSPFNYGAVPGTLAPDGDPLDAVVLGPRLAAGSRLVVTVHGVVHFVDDGDQDPKLLVGEAPPSDGDLARVRSFFAAYARAKALLNRVRRRHGATRVDGVQVPADRDVLLGWLDR